MSDQPVPAPAAPRQSSPADCTFPVIRYNFRVDKVLEVLGTGFFIDQEGSFVAAKHVFLETAFKQAEVPAALLPDGKGQLRKMKLAKLEYSSRYDIARGKVERHKPQVYAIVPKEKVPPLRAGTPTIAVAYSTPAAGRGKAEQVPVDAVAFQESGYILRQYKSNFGQPFPVPCFELSHPVLTGGTGGPVFSQDTGHLLGLMIGNLEYRLLPEKRLSNGGEENLIRSARYTRIVGAALEVGLLREFIYPPEEKKPQIREMWQKLKTRFKQERNGE